jgi:E3 ubiquitin-protein ligase NEDD4
LSVFDYQELDLLICGTPDIDLNDWKRHTEYLGQYQKLGNKHQVIKWFWSVVDNFSKSRKTIFIFNIFCYRYCYLIYSEEQIRLLQFATGCSRLPAQGFKALQSNDGKYRNFNIQSINKTV